MKDKFTKQWIIQSSIDIVDDYEKGMLTIRALHYQLVGRLGMTNDIQHYKRVVSAMEFARWEGLIAFDTFSDLDRAMIGSTACEETDVHESIEDAKSAMRSWMMNYYKNRWENQPYYPEIFIEKKALQGVFQSICSDWDVALGACKGYPSLTFLNEANLRFAHARSLGKEPIIIYFGDYDPSGEDIPRSIKQNISKLGTEIQVKRIALLDWQVEEWNLPHAPAKITDSRTANWDGVGQVELDAVEPRKLQELCENAIKDIFYDNLYDELKSRESEERVTYRAELQKYVNPLNDGSNE